MKKIRVVVVDDSALVRSLLAEIINREKDMECVGAANDPLIARDMIRELNPDVITLDIEMPRMDGIDFLARLMRLRPMPVVMISTLTERGAEVTMKALELGAVDFVAKPRIGVADGLSELAVQIVDKVRIAAAAHIKRAVGLPPASGAGASAPASARATLASIGRVSTEKLICIGASTGGTEAIKDVLVCLPPDCPGILITQHMPEGFTKSFAARLDTLCRISVSEAVHNERVLPGHAYIAPGHSHLLLKKSGANYMTELSQSEPVNRHRPAVDVLFRSAAKYAGSNSVGVILTGMGKDGAAGMLEMKQVGSRTIAQDEASCVVFGMPKEAIARGGVDEVLPLHEIPRRVMAHLATLGGRAIRV